uniref:Uncharacterized protein n=1 Tax=Noctiluca scintillans TaxID=2966 RepID=A0A7S1FF98_NOCSC
MAQALFREVWVSIPVFLVTTFHNMLRGFPGPCSPSALNEKPDFSGRHDYVEEPHFDYGGVPLALKHGISYPRRPPNIVVLFTCVVLPWFLFTVPYGLALVASYSCSFAVAAANLVVVAVIATVGYSAWLTSRDPFNSDHAAWMMLLFVMCLAAGVSGIFFGAANFKVNAQPYHDVKSLNEYQSVDPSLYRGNQLMDAGRVEFTTNAYLDTSKTIGFQSDNIYCVAPISSGPSETYDFWAVGINCCPGSTNSDFRCGEYSNAAAHSGLRLMRDDDRAFYRLAVQQAEVAYHIKANHPLFFIWMHDPEIELQAYLADGFRVLALGVVLCLAATLFTTIGAVITLR